MKMKKAMLRKQKTWEVWGCKIRCNSQSFFHFQSSFLHAKCLSLNVQKIYSFDVPSRGYFSCRSICRILDKPAGDVWASLRLRYGGRIKHGPWELCSDQFHLLPWDCGIHLHTQQDCKRLTRTLPLPRQNHL